MCKLHCHCADSARCADDDDPLFCMEFQRIHRREGHETRNSARRSGSERKGIGLLRNPVLVNSTELGPCPFGVERHLHAEYGFTDRGRAHVPSDGDDDSSEIATRCHRPIASGTFAYGDASVECPLGNVDVVDVDGGSKYFYEHLPGTRYRFSDFHHLKNVSECARGRPSR